MRGKIIGPNRKAFDNHWSFLTSRGGRALTIGLGETQDTTWALAEADGQDFLVLNDEAQARFMMAALNSRSRGDVAVTSLPPMELAEHYEV